jgi:putative oxidoreductase
LGLGLFTFATNIFHPFWAVSGEMAALQLSLFFKNVAIGGALLMTFAVLARRGL